MSYEEDLTTRIAACIVEARACIAELEEALRGLRLDVYDRATEAALRAEIKGLRAALDAMARDAAAKRADIP